MSEQTCTCGHIKGLHQSSTGQPRSCVGYRPWRGYRAFLQVHGVTPPKCSCETCQPPCRSCAEISSGDCGSHGPLITGVTISPLEQYSQYPVDAVRTAYQRGHADGVRETLAEVAKLPSPIRNWAQFGNIADGERCVWCEAKWTDWKLHHPANGCLWPRALAAHRPEP